MQTCAAPVESSVEMPRGMENSYGPATPLPGVDPKTSETPVWKNISISTFIAALFTVAKIWKPPKRPSVDEWIKKRGCACVVRMKSYRF